jgi:hypothetical protein
MADLNNTLLALQVLNGVRMYSVRIAGGAHNRYTYKAHREYEIGSAVLVQTKSTFVAGIVEALIEDFDYDQAHEWKWVLFNIDNPEAVAKEYDEMDRSSKRKLMQAQAVQSAKNLLEASGLSMADMKAMFLNAPKGG